MLLGFFKKLHGGQVVRPNDREQLIAAGTAAFRHHDYGPARDAFLQANVIQPLDAEGLRMLGASLLHTGRLDEAELALRGALGLRPDHVEIHWLLAMKHLLAGNWQEGLSRYEACRNAYMNYSPDQEANRNWLRCVQESLQGMPRWKGEPLGGKKLLVWSEYGHGDAIMNLRFLPVVRERYAPDEIAFMSAAEEQCLFEATGGGRFVETQWGWRPMPGEFDLHCSLISLSHLLKADPLGVPGPVPYLTVAPERRAYWANRLSAKAGFKVGLCWLDSQAGVRCIAPEKLAPLFKVDGVQYFSLQGDDKSRKALQSTFATMADMMDECGNFMDTAALIENLDLVVSIDSAIAHLAGAIGKPVWLLNRFESEWRWMRNREDSVWYPTMRIFNQPEPGNWGPVVARLAQELSAAAQAHEKTI